MNGFLTPDNPYNLFLPQLSKFISDLGLPYTIKDNFRMLEEMTDSGMTISDSTLNKLTKGEDLGKNAHMKLGKLRENIGNVYQPSPSISEITKRTLSVRSNATDWLYALDGFTQGREVKAWPNTIGFINRRCIEDIEIFEKLKKIEGKEARLEIYFSLLKEHTLIPAHLLERFDRVIQNQNSSGEKKPLGLPETNNALLFNFYLNVDFLFSIAAHFERDLDIPHFDLNSDYEPQCRLGKTIDYFIHENKFGTDGYRNLFGCFLNWLIEHMPKPDGTHLDWSELASCISLPDKSTSVETLEKRQYDELRKWRKAKTTRHKPGNKKLSEFVARLFSLGDDNNGQADIVYLMLKFFMLLDGRILQWEEKIMQVQAKTGFDTGIDSSALIHSVLIKYYAHWRHSAITSNSDGQPKPSTAMNDF